MIWVYVIIGIFFALATIFTIGMIISAGITSKRLGEK